MSKSSSPGEARPGAPRVRAARPDEAALLSALAMRSKAHWGYSAEQLAVFRDELTLTADDVVEGRAHVAEAAGRVLGFYSLEAHSEREIELGHLFVEPTALGRGVGTRLFAHACAEARSAGAAALVIQSDPNAASFYRAHGAVHERDVPSSIPGRALPFFRLNLAQDPAPGA